MGSPRRLETSPGPKTARIEVRASPAEKARWAARAEAHSITLCDFIRAGLNEIANDGSEVMRRRQARQRIERQVRNIRADARLLSPALYRDLSNLPTALTAYEEIAQ